MLLTTFSGGGACPEQWEGRATRSDGREVVVYLRHRHGYGKVSIGSTIDDAVMPRSELARDWHCYWGTGRDMGDGIELLAWHDEDWDGMLRPGALPHILHLAGFDLAPEIAASLVTSPGAGDFIEAAAELGIHLAEIGGPDA